MMSSLYLVPLHLRFFIFTVVLSTFILATTPEVRLRLPQRGRVFLVSSDRKICSPVALVPHHSLRIALAFPRPLRRTGIRTLVYIPYE